MGTSAFTIVVVWITCIKFAARHARYRSISRISSCALHVAPPFAAMKPSSKYKPQKPAAAAAAASSDDGRQQSSDKLRGHEGGQESSDKLRGDKGQLPLKVKSEIIEDEDTQCTETEQQIERRRALEILNKDKVQSSRQRSRSLRRSASDATTLVLGSSCYCDSSSASDEDH